MSELADRLVAAADIALRGHRRILQLGMPEVAAVALLRELEAQGYVIASRGLRTTEIIYPSGLAYEIEGKGR